MTLAPGITQWLPLPYGQFGELLSDPIEFHQQTRVRFGDVLRFRVGPFVLHFLYHPDHVRHVFFDNPKNYVRGWQYKLLGKLFGDNLVASEGPSWLRQRRLAQPAFHRQRLAGYADVMVDSVSQLLSRWHAAGAHHEIDVAPEMSRLALAIASRTLFDQDASQEADDVGRSFRIVSQYFEMRFNNAFTSLPSWVPTPTNRRFKQAVRTLFQIMLTIIQHKGAYFPFLGGAHQCIGNEFAMIEMQLIVAMVLRQVDLDIMPDQSIRPKASIQLRPNGPVRIILKPMVGRTIGSTGAAGRATSEINVGWPRPG